MPEVKEFDKSVLLQLLKVSDDHNAFAHGQLRRAASRAIKDFGYAWAAIPPDLNVEESAQLLRLRSQLKRTVFESTKGWHSNQSVVWSRFRAYAKRVGSRHEALALIAKIRNKVSQ